MLVEDEVKTEGAAFIQDTFRSLLATLFYIGSSVTHDVAIYGREHVTDLHPKIIACNHKRDLDSLVVCSITYFARGITRPNRRLTFGVREDTYWPRFLNGYLRWPWPFHPILTHVRLAPVMKLLKAYPIGALNDRDQLSHIQSQLRQFADLLDRGRDLYWTPEGGLGLAGKFGEFKAGFNRLIRESHATLRVLPVAIFYDFMTTRRTRCFIRFGPEWEVDRRLGRAELAQRTRDSILAQMTMNIGHLAAAVLNSLAPGTRFSRPELERLLLAKAGHYRRMGLFLDPRLTMRWTFKRRLDRFLGYARRERILRQRDGVWEVDLGLQHGEMQYVLNELSEVDDLTVPAVPSGG